LDIAQNYWTLYKKFGPLSENPLPPLATQADYGSGYTTQMYSINGINAFYVSGPM